MVLNKIIVPTLTEPACVCVCLCVSVCLYVSVRVCVFSGARHGHMVTECGSLVVVTDIAAELFVWLFMSVTSCAECL